MIPIVLAVFTVAAALVLWYINTRKEIFPSNLLGKGYQKYEFFEAEAYKRVDVEMKFH